jgi:hypothetical protein
MGTQEIRKKRVQVRGTIELPPRGPKDQLSFSIGGCFGHSHALELKHGAFWYSVFKAGHAPPERRERLSASPERWATFWEEMDKIGVWAWEPNYSNHEVLDGTQWELKLRHGNLQLKSHGSNGYPGENGPEYSPTSAFAKLLAALKDLSGVDGIA